MFQLNNVTETERTKMTGEYLNEFSILIINTSVV